MRVPSNIMFNKTCSIYSEVNAFDAVNAPVKTAVLLYSGVPCRNCGASNDEINQAGSERAIEMQSVYIPYANYPLVTTASRVVLSDNSEYDITHADNVDLQNCFWQLHCRLANGSNAEVDWDNNPLPVISSLTATITGTGTWTQIGYLTCAINAQPPAYAMPIYAGPTTGTADAANIFMGNIINSGVFTFSRYIRLPINSVNRYLPYYTWDSVIGGAASTISGLTTPNNMSAGQYVRIYVNNLNTTVWIRSYSTAPL